MSSREQQVRDSEFFRFRCAVCGKRLKALPEEVGRQGRCTRCGRPMRVPSPDAGQKAVAERGAARPPLAPPYKGGGRDEVQGGERSELKGGEQSEAQGGERSELESRQQSGLRGEPNEARATGLGEAGGASRQATPGGDSAAVDRDRARRARSWSHEGASGRLRSSYETRRHEVSGAGGARRKEERGPEAGAERRGAGAARGPSRDAVRVQRVALPARRARGPVRAAAAPPVHGFEEFEGVVEILAEAGGGRCAAGAAPAADDRLAPYRAARRWPRTIVKLLVPLLCVVLLLGTLWFLVMSD